MIADVDQPARMRELAALERGGDALIRGAGKHDEDQHRRGGAERAAARDVSEHGAH